MSFAKPRELPATLGMTREAFKQYLWTAQAGRCLYCDRPMRRYSRRRHPDEATFDHIMPLSRGGASHYANVALSHRSCNEEKADSHPAEWFPRVGREWIGPPAPSPVVKRVAAPAVILYRPAPGEMPAWLAKRQQEDESRERLRQLASSAIAAMGFEELREERKRLVEMAQEGPRCKELPSVQRRLAKVNARLAALSPPPNPPGSRAIRKAIRTATFYVGAAWNYEWPR